MGFITKQLNIINTMDYTDTMVNNVCLLNHLPLAKKLRDITLRHA